MAKRKKAEEQAAIHAPDTYREMAEPFADVEGLNKALAGFSEEVRALRAKYRLADVLVVVKDAYVHDDGEIPMMARFNAGNSLNCLPMATWLYAKENADHKSLMRDILKMGEDAT